MPSPEAGGRVDLLPDAELAAWTAAAELPPMPNRGAPEAAWFPAAELLPPPKLNTGALEAAWLPAAELPPMPNRGAPEAAWFPAAELLLPPKLNVGAAEAAWLPAAELPPMPNRGAPEAAWFPAAGLLLPPKLNMGASEAAWLPAAELLLLPKLNRGAPGAAWLPAAELLPPKPKTGAPADELEPNNPPAELAPTLRPGAPDVGAWLAAAELAPNMVPWLLPLAKRGAWLAAGLLASAALLPKANGGRPKDSAALPARPWVWLAAAELAPTAGGPRVLLPTGGVCEPSSAMDGRLAAAEALPNPLSNPPKAAEPPGVAAEPGAGAAALLPAGSPALGLPNPKVLVDPSPAWPKLPAALSRGWLPVVAAPATAEHSNLYRNSSQ